MGDTVKHELLLRDNQSPHHLSLQLSQLKNLQEADLLVWVGPEFEAYLVDPAKAVRAAIAMSSLQGILWLRTQQGMHSPETLPGDRHGHFRDDPHVWLELENVAIFANGLIKTAKTMGLAESDQALDRRLELFLQNIEFLRDRVQSSLAPMEGGFGVYHDGFSYYVSAYTLEQMGVLVDSQDQKISLKRLGELKVQLRGAKCVLADRTEISQAKRYEKTFGLPVVEVDLLGQKSDTFEDYYLKIAAAITRCLSVKTAF